MQYWYGVRGYFQFSCFKLVSSYRVPLACLFHIHKSKKHKFIVKSIRFAFKYTNALAYEYTLWARVSPSHKCINDSDFHVFPNFKLHLFIAWRCNIAQFCLLLFTFVHSLYIEQACLISQHKCLLVCLWISTNFFSIFINISSNAEIV